MIHKFNALIFFLIVSLASTLSCGHVFAQLTAGDIAIIGFNADGTDDFSFVTLTDIAPLTVVSFTDNEWDGSVITSGEGTVGWTAPAGGVSAGTVVIINDPSGTISANVGSASVSSGSFNFAASGDQILAYQGLEASPTFLFGIETNSTAWGASGGSLVPTGLVDGATALAIGSGGLGADADNGRYIGVRIGTQASLLNAIANVNSSGGNWMTTDGAGDQSLTFDDTPFTIVTGTPTFIAGTSFEEPTAGGTSTDASTVDHELSNVNGATVTYTSVGGELGFRSFLANAGGDDGVNNDFIGVTNFTGDVGSYDDGVQGYEITDSDGDLTIVLDTVDLTGYDTAEVSAAVFVIDTSFEGADTVRIFAEVDGGTEIDLLNLNAAALDLAAGTGWFTVSADLSGYSSATLNLSANFNANTEGVYFDDIVFQGIAANVPEPASILVWSLIGMVTFVGAVVVRRRQK